MPDVSRTVVVDAPPDATWTFVSSISSWAALVPGFESMREIDDRHSEWRVRGDLGILSRLVTLEIAVTEWISGSKVAFIVHCIEEPLDGDGSLIVRGARDTTELTFNLSVEAGGMLGPVVNALLPPVLGQMASDFASGVKATAEATFRGVAR